MPSEISTLSDRMSDCIDDVASWVTSNHLQLNPLKTEVLCCWSTHQMPSAPLSVGLVTVALAVAVKDLGVHLDADLTFWTHVRAVVRSSCAALRQIRTVWCSLPQYACTR